MRRLAALVFNGALGVLALGALGVGCSSGGDEPAGGTGGMTTGSGGHVGTGGVPQSGVGGITGTGGMAAGQGGMTTGSGGMTTGSGGMTTGTGGMTTGSGGHVGTGGVPQSGVGGITGTGGITGAGGVAPSTYTCNMVLGIDSTSEWFTGGFENQVPNARWEIIYYHPGYVEDWASTTDMVWSVAATSPCTANATNPERVIFNAFGDTSDTAFMNTASWVTGLTKVVENLKKKYSRLQRIDLLAMTRAPNNTPCVSTNRMSIVETYVDDAMRMVAAAYPGLVTVSPKFFAPSCDVFMDGGPHFTTAGKPIVAKVYGDYYSAEP